MAGHPPDELQPDQGAEEGIDNFMCRFYILMTLLLSIGVINLVRSLKEKQSRYRTFGVAINILGIVLLVAAVIIALLQ